MKKITKLINGETIACIACGVASLCCGLSGNAFAAGFLGFSAAISGLTIYVSKKGDE